MGLSSGLVTPTSSSWRMADRLCGHRLAEIVLLFAADGMAWDRMAKQLYVNYGIEVTGETLRKWHSLLVDANEVPA